MPGAAAYHQAPGRKARASAIMRPHSGDGGGGPSPRKPSAEAVRIVPPSPIEVRMMMEGAIAGRICSTITRHGEAPKAIAASI